MDRLRATAFVLAILALACSSRSSTTVKATGSDSPAGSAIVKTPTDSGTSATVGTTVDSTAAVELVRRLVAKPPERMSELEAIVGPIKMSFRNEDHENMGFLDRPRLLDEGGSNAPAEFTALVPRLRINYKFDRYHQEPTRPRDVALDHYTLEVRGDFAAVEPILRDKFGAPRTVVDRGTSYAAFHPFYLARDPAAADRVLLAWYDEVPRFAIAEPDASARTTWLRAFAQRLATAKTVDEVDAFCKAAPRNAGIQITGTLNRTANPYGRPTKDARDYWIKFVPPVKALTLASAFGWGTIVGASHDTHMSSWHVERKIDSWLPLTGAQTQWEIDASFVRMPRGGAVPRGGPFDAQAVTDADEIESFAVRPRFK